MKKLQEIFFKKFIIFVFLVVHGKVKWKKVFSYEGLHFLQTFLIFI